MTRAWLGAFASVIVILVACGPGVEEADVDTEDSSSTDGSTNPTTSPTTDPTVTASDPTASASAEGTEDTNADTGSIDTGSNDTGSTGSSSGGSETTTDADTSATGSTGDSGGSSSGGSPSDDYPSCMSDDDCAEPYTLCWPPMKFGDPNFCTLECGDAGDCPVPSTGAAVPVCEGPPDTDICVLDCTDGDCPDGMSCIDVFGDGNFLRCTWA